MRGYNCYIYHLKNNKLVQNSNNACWAGLNKSKYFNTDIYVDKYIGSKITDKQRKRIVYLINKIIPCKFVKIKGLSYIRYKLLSNHYLNLLLLNFIRILWYKNQSFNNEQFFIDICKRKPRNLDYLEFMMTCIKNNVDNSNAYGHGNHSFVYPNIIPKTKEMLLKYTGNSMCNFLQCKIKDIK